MVRPPIITRPFYGRPGSPASAGETLIGSSKEVLDQWFQGDADTARPALWFGGGRATDDEMRDRFADDVEAALTGAYDGWSRTPRGRLALVLLLDQFTRNIHRGTRKAFAGDRAAQRHASKGVLKGDDVVLRPLERAFLYMPFMHAEDRHLQRRGCILYERLVHEAPPSLRETVAGFYHYAQDHQAVVERFGRFPDRNRILGRESTPEEQRFLDEEPRDWFEPQD